MKTYLLIALTLFISTVSAQYLDAIGEGYSSLDGTQKGFICTNENRAHVLHQARYMAMKDAEDQCHSPVSYLDTEEEHTSCELYGLIIKAKVKARYLCLTDLRCKWPLVDCDEGCCMQRFP